VGGQILGSAFKSAAVSEAKGLVFNIMRFSLHDGPGIRTTVFLKGCPLSCWWCHNPESQGGRPEVMYAADRCVRCGDCVSACEHGALAFSNGPVRDPDLCVQCGDCAAKCLTDARRYVGEWMSVQDVVRKVRRDIVFFDESRGGVTFSGGEPLMQPDFLEAGLKACRAEGIHTAIDTCGFASEETLWRIMPLADLVLFDLKMVDAERHRQVTGVSNDVILENLSTLVKAEKPLIVRIPVVPGVNDDEANIGDSMDLLARFGVKRVDLLPYHEAGTEKYQRLGSKYPLASLKPPAAETMKDLSDRFCRAGFAVRIGG
jgi:pyruvate formate lyase activating enzyme